MVIISIDYGDARTGVAVCDKNEILCSPVKTIAQRNKEKLIEEIAEITKQKNAELIVVGLPLNMDGTEGERAALCRNFAEELKSVTGIECELYDERCTTVISARALNVTDTRGKKRKSVIDTLSAVIILEDFIKKKHNDSEKK